MRVVILTLVSGLLMSGCEQIPGTEQNRIAKGEKVAAALLIDPSSAQFRKTFLRPGPKAEDPEADGPRWVVCGEINGKNRNGAYVGFSRFLADPDSEDAYLEPISLVSEEEAQRSFEQCRRGAEGPIYSEADRELRLMQCDLAKEQIAERMAAAEFDMAYAAMCAQGDEQEERAAAPDAIAPASEQAPD